MDAFSSSTEDYSPKLVSYVQGELRGGGAGTPQKEKKPFKVWNASLTVGLQWCILRHQNA